MVALITSPLIRAPHGFPTREGGASVGPWASLNTSFAVGDSPEAVEVNLRRLAQALGVAPGALATITQVHGLTLVEAHAADPAVVRGPLAEADAVWTQTPGVAVGVRTADCLPVLIEDPVGGRVAAVHAGWRGVLGELPRRTVERLVAAGSHVVDLRVALGPAIGPCCFEVDGDLPARFEAAFGREVVVPVAGKPRLHLNLGLAVRRSLERAGVPAGQIDQVPGCTAHEPRFFSHRRDQGQTGRHLSVVVCPQVLHAC